MNWNGERLETFGEVAKALYALENAEEAQEFVKAYESENPYAKENIGYMLGYLNDGDRRSELYEWCSVVHPVLGMSI